MSPDPRKVLGALVTTKATHVTNATECARRYGSNAKTKILVGTVTEVIVDRSNPTNRAQTYIVADWELGTGRTKSSKVHIRFISLKADEVAETGPLITMDHVYQAIASLEDNNDDNDNNNDAAPIDNDEPMGDGTEAAPEPPVEVPAEPPVEQPAPAVAETVIANHLMEEAAIEAARQVVRDLPIVEVHGRQWFTYPGDYGANFNGAIPYREWGLRLPTGEVWREGCNDDETITRLDVFLQMFPSRQLISCWQLTNIQLQKKNYKETTKQEVLKFFGVILLASRYEWNKRSDLWMEHPPSKYEVAPAIGKKTDFRRKRFDELWSCIRFSAQPDAIPDGMASEPYRWMLVDGFIRNFNNHRANFFIPSDRICVDESFSRWYGQGGGWINHGLPHYVSMDRKPEDGCEIQNAACGRTGIMLQLRLVKGGNSHEDDDAEVGGALNNGTKLVLKLTMPWWRTDRVVCADSYFASVQTAKELLKKGLRFVGVVKTATSEYPMAHLQSQELEERGDRYALLTKDDNNNPFLFCFVWMDRERRYFISSGLSMQEGKPQERERWRQLVTDLTTPPTKVHLVVPQPVAAEVYYDACGKIDQHNRDRQATLGLERKFRTHDWSMRVNMSILSMCLVDSWRIWMRINNINEGDTAIETQKQFYGYLSAELIDNNYDRVGGQVRQANVNNSFVDIDINPDLVDPVTGKPRAGDGVYIRRCTKRRKNTNHVHQGRCMVCKIKTSYICAACMDDEDNPKQPWVCNSETGRMCFATHRMLKHSDD